MKSSKFLLILLSLTVTFSACQKDEEPAPEPGLPAGNYIKFQGVTYLENEWTASEYWVQPGNRPTIKISLNADKSKALGISFQDAVSEKTYVMSNKHDGTNNATVVFTQGAEYCLPEVNGNGTVTVTVVDGKKVVEVHGAMYSPFGKEGGYMDARFVWTE